MCAPAPSPLPFSLPPLSCLAGGGATGTAEVQGTRSRFARTAAPSPRKARTPDLGGAEP